MGEYDNIEFNEIDRPKKIRKKKHYLLRFVLFLAFVGIVMGVLSSSIFDVKKIEVSGNNYYSRDDIINIADAKTGNNILWGTDASEIEKRLLDNPYISEVDISRKFPDTIEIAVKEREQVAAIVYGDKYVVIDVNGNVLRKSKIDPKLTLIRGLTISRLEVGKEVEAEEIRTLKKTLQMLSAMKEGDIYFKKIDVSGVIIKAYIYDVMVVKGTPNQMVASINDGRLHRVITKLFEDKIKRGTITLGSGNYISYSPRV